MDRSDSADRDYGLRCRSGCDRDKFSSCATALFDLGFLFLVLSTVLLVLFKCFFILNFFSKYVLIIKNKSSNILIIMILQKHFHEIFFIAVLKLL